MPLTTTQKIEARDLHRAASAMDQLAAMPRPLSEAEAEQLVVRFGAEAARTQLERMNNRVGLADKYRSVYLTCIKWFDIDCQKGYTLPSRTIDCSTATTQYDDEAPSKPLNAAVADFLEAHPVGSTIEGRWFVTNESMIEDKLKHGFVPIQYFINNYNRTIVR